jgi:PAS domain S-box-containing protein
MGRTLIINDITDLVEGTGDPAFGVDAAHTIVAWNRAAEDLLQYRAEDVAGRDCAQVISGRDSQGHIICNTLCPFRLAMVRGDRLRQIDLQIRRRDGTAVWVSMTSLVLAAGDLYVIHILRDITEDRTRAAFVQQVLQAASSLTSGPPAEPTRNGPVLLSPRETEILKLLAAGASTRLIAETLSISPATVRNHIQQVMTALRAHSRLEAVVKALQLRLL